MIETKQYATTCSGGGGWDLNGTADPVETLTDYTDSKYLYEWGDTATLSDSFSTFDWSSITNDAYIQTVTFSHWDNEDGTGDAGTYTGRLYLGASYTESSAYDTGVTKTLRSWSVARPGGGSWGYADLASIAIRFQNTGNGAGTAWNMIHEAYVTITWDHQAGCFFPIWSWVLPALGSGLELAHMPGLARYIYEHAPARARTRIRPESYAPALRSLREYRWPAYAF